MRSAATSVTRSPMSGDSPVVSKSIMTMGLSNTFMASLKYLTQARGVGRRWPAGIGLFEPAELAHGVQRQAGADAAEQIALDLARRRHQRGDFFAQQAHAARSAGEEDGVDGIRLDAGVERRAPAARKNRRA